jgi:hypothetical protein
MHRVVIGTELRVRRRLRAPRALLRGSFESGRATEAARVLDLTPAFEDEQDFEELLASGAFDMLLA